MADDAVLGTSGDGDWTRNVVLITGADGKGHGSGFVARRAGVVAHVVTCAHVVTDLGPDGLLANGRPAKVLYDGTGDGIDLAVVAAEGLTEEAQTLTRGAHVGDAVFAIGFTRVDRGRRATARPATIRETTQLTYDPAKVVRKHQGWILSIDGDPITDGFSGGPVIDARTGMVIGVLGLRGTGTADVIGIRNLSSWKDAPPAVSPIRDEVADLKKSARLSRGLAMVLGLALGVAIAVLAMRQPGLSINVSPPAIGSGSTRGGGLLQVLLGTDEVTVDARSGWQLSRYEYNAGDVLCIEPTGRVNVAGAEVINFAQIWRSLLVEHAPGGSRLLAFKETYPPQPLDAWNRFRSLWSGPEGLQGVSDEMLAECLLRPDQPWGALLVVELPRVGNAFYEARDPIAVLTGVNLKPDAIVPAGSARPHTMGGAKGERHQLAFIVNDAVLSPSSTAPICKDTLAAFQKTRRDLINDDMHQLDLAQAALLPYLDNVGEFHVRITPASSSTNPCMSTMIRPSNGSGSNSVAPIDDLPPGGSSVGTGSGTGTGTGTNPPRRTPTRRNP